MKQLFNAGVRLEQALTESSAVGVSSTGRSPLWKPSVTVAAVIEREGEFLLVEERAEGRVVYNQPAGHWEPGETLVDGCAREVLEESGYRFKPTEVLGFFTWQHPQTGTTFVRIAFTGELLGHEADRPLDKEIIRAVWLTPEALRAESAKHRSPLVMACIERYLSGKRYPLDVIAHF